MERYHVIGGHLRLDPEGTVTSYADAQRAIDAEREKVAFLEKKNANLVEASNLVLKVKADQDEQLATLQAQLADRDAMILQMGEQAAVLAKENMAVKAQLRQVEGERNTARHRVDELEAREIDVEILQGDLTTLQAQVEGLEQGCFIHHVDKEQAEMKIALLEGTIGMRATERIDLLSQLENTEAQIRQVEVENELLKSGQRYMALEKERDALRQLVEALPVVPDNVIGRYMADMRKYDAQDYTAIANLLNYRATLAAQARDKVADYVDGKDCPTWQAK
jgi:chromosome segregation ATPase